MVLIISDTSVKNNVTTLILHICREQEIIAKTIYHTINVMFTEAKLFTIRYSINYATQMQDLTHIIIITDAISVAKQIFDMSIYPY